MHRRKQDMVENILFMIDTSASMSDAMITAAWSEIKGAIDQFDGKLRGWLGFFDAAVVQPEPFENEEEFRVIRPAGGGGGVGEGMGGVRRTPSSRSSRRRRRRRSGLRPCLPR